MLINDPRFVFFTQQEGVMPTPKHGSNSTWYVNSVEDTKYYYRKNGDNLEPLGKFTMIILYHNQHDRRPIIPYCFYSMYFDRQHFNNDVGDELYYTDEPPAVGSIPLTIHDIPMIDGPPAKKKGGYCKRTKTRACKQFDDIRLQKLNKNKDFNKTQKKKYYKMLKKCILSKV
jgi:hypothetical protein